MNWKNLKLNGKFGIAFGSIIGLLIFISIWATTGVNGIVKNADEVIHGNELRANLEDKYVQHLHWVQKVNALLTDENITKLEVETDPQKCDFGKWYYGEGRKEAEKLIPELKDVIAQMEEPHKHLHQSAVKIDEIFEQLDWNVAIQLRQAKLDHVNWMNHVKDAIFIDNSKSINVVKDASLCKFGKWMESDMVKDLRQNHTETNSALNKIEAAHEKLHQSVILAEDYLSSGQNGQARSYYKNTIVPNTEGVLNGIDEFITWFETDLNNMREADRIYHDETTIYLEQLGGLFDKLVHESKDYMMTDEEMLHAASNTSSSIVLISVIISILAILFAFVLSRGIISPINKSVLFAQKLSDGDLTASIDIEQDDEIGKLGKALQNMVDQLRYIIGDVVGGADNINAASRELSNTSQQMSQGASEQASSAEEISSSMEEMVSNIQQNTHNAIETEKIANQAVEAIKKGSQSTTVAVQSMKDIAAKVSIIGDIAFQTNILALNAAVEAARAGEHGQGFAVVAEEVRKLAEKSQIAAEEIDVLTINGVTIADETGKQLSDIVPEIEKTARLVQEIAAASMEQNSGADEINNAIQQLNQVIQQNAAASEETASSSEELSAQSEKMKDVVSYFRLDHSVRFNYAANRKPHVMKAPAAANVNVKKKSKSDENVSETSVIPDQSISDEFQQF